MPEQYGGGGISFPLTNTADETFQPNNVANNALTIHNPASAVNGVQIVGANTGSSPQIVAVGGDANVGLSISGKGTGQVKIASVAVDSSSNIQIPNTSRFYTLSNTGLIGWFGTDTATADILDYGFNILQQNDGNGSGLAAPSTGFGGLLCRMDLRSGNPSSIPNLSTTGPQIYFLIQQAGSGGSGTPRLAMDQNGSIGTSTGGTTYLQNNAVIGGAGLTVGFYGTAGVTRAAAITQPASTAATNVTPYGYTTQVQADAIRSAVQAIITALQNIGITS